MCVILLLMCTLFTKGNSQSSQCDLLFPRNGDYYDFHGEKTVYNLVTCRFSASDMRKFGPVANITIQSDYFLFGNDEHIYVGTVTHHVGAVSKVFASSFSLSGNSWVPTTRYKFIHSVYVGMELVQQLPVFFMFLNTLDFQKLAEPPTYASLNAGAKPGNPQHFDFLEIGTSAFHTLLQLVTDYQSGVSVEPLKDYLDFLPSPPNVHKENVAVGLTSSVAHIYHWPKGIIESYGITIDGPYNYLHGLSTIGGVNPDIVTMFNRNGGNYAPSIHALTHTPVLVRTPEEIFNKYNIGGLGYLKLDCEGMDVSILKSVVNMMRRRNLSYPCLIEYEDIHLQSEGLNMLTAIPGYQIYVLKHYPESSTTYDNLIVFAERISYEQSGREECSIGYHNSLTNLVPDTLLIARRLCGDSGGQICCVEYGAIGDDITTAGSLCRLP